jgi:hypothetical protein
VLATLEGQNAMTIRTTHKTVTFNRPFVLSSEGPLPAGVYEVDTDEELIDGLSFIAYRRVATFIKIRRNGATEVVQIHPADLDAAIVLDAEAVP